MTLVVSCLKPEPSGGSEVSDRRRDRSEGRLSEAASGVGRVGSAAGRTTARRCRSAVGRGPVQPPRRPGAAESVGPVGGNVLSPTPRSPQGERAMGLCPTRLATSVPFASPSPWPCGPVFLDRPRTVRSRPASPTNGRAFDGRSRCPARTPGIPRPAGPARGTAQCGAEATEVRDSRASGTDPGVCFDDPVESWIHRCVRKGTGPPRRRRHGSSRSSAVTVVRAGRAWPPPARAMPRSARRSSQGSGCEHGYPSSR
jgi:hypothetical protein